VAAALLDGPTVVVSPLIALQQDQVQAIANQEVGLAAAANSTLSQREREWIFDAIATGGLEFLFVSPEQLAKEDTVARLAEAKPSLFVVDEAHCISEWGHDFRTDYLRLAAAAEALGRPPILALTATASPVVRDEIVERLRLQDPEVVVRGFDRPNLRIEVETHHRVRDKLDAARGHVAGSRAPASSYVATRRSAEEVAAALVERNRPARRALPRGDARRRPPGRAGRLHGRRRGGRRGDHRPSAWGIDKADVRSSSTTTCPSRSTPGTRSGRAGRDGEPAVTILLWRPEDLGLRSFSQAAAPSGRRARAGAAMRRWPESRCRPRPRGRGPPRSHPPRGLALARLEEVGGR
jgi:ATP-dependent DNA helicase RecQ